MDKLIDLLLSRTIFEKIKTYVDGFVNQLVEIVTGIDNDVTNLESDVTANTSAISNLNSKVANMVTLEAVYPVGAVYMSTVSTSPATLFGFGSWTRIQGRFLLGAGSSYSVNGTGGEATHTLTTSEIPAHTHATYRQNSAGTISGIFTYSASNTIPGYIVNSGSTGGGSAHNNMPPYYVVYIWRRTA